MEKSVLRKAGTFFWKVEKCLPCLSLCNIPTSFNNIPGN